MAEKIEMPQLDDLELDEELKKLRKKQAEELAKKVAEAQPALEEAGELIPEELDSAPQISEEFEDGLTEVAVQNEEAESEPQNDAGFIQTEESSNPDTAGNSEEELEQLPEGEPNELKEETNDENYTSKSDEVETSELENTLNPQTENTQQENTEEHNEVPFADNSNSELADENNLIALTENSENRFTETKQSSSANLNNATESPPKDPTRPNRNLGIIGDDGELTDEAIKMLAGEENEASFPIENSEARKLKEESSDSPFETSRPENSPYIRPTMDSYKQKNPEHVAQNPAEAASADVRKPFLPESNADESTKNKKREDLADTANQEIAQRQERAEAKAPQESKGNSVNDELKTGTAPSTVGAVSTPQQQKPNQNQNPSVPSKGETKSPDKQPDEKTTESNSGWVGCVIVIIAIILIILIGIGCAQDPTSAICTEVNGFIDSVTLLFRR